MRSRFLKYLLLSVLFSFADKLFAQEMEIEEIEEGIIEMLEEVIDEKIDISEIMERLRYYLLHPIDLNRADEAILSELLFLTPLQIQGLISHREISGRFISELELQAVPGFDKKTIRLLLPFVTLSAKSVYDDLRLSDVIKEADQELMVRYGRVLEKQVGYNIEDTMRSRYLGSPDRVSLRYRLNYKNTVRLSLNMEKDAGEPFLKYDQQYGFDFYSGSLYAKDIGAWKNIVVGDYVLQFGQGLVLWNGLSFGKGAWINSMAKQGGGVRAYTSMNESNFLRGVAGTYNYKHLYVTPFLSANKITATVDEIEGMRYISSISSSGLHRTPSEQDNRKSTLQNLYGLHMAYHRNRLRLGGTITYTYFDGEIVSGSQIRNRYDFVGKDLWSLSVNYNYTFRNVYFYGETASNISSGLATNNGLIASLHPQLSAVINQRYYAKDYHSFFAQAVGETSGVNNESGVYAGVVYHPSRRIEWVNYIDLFTFPWLRYQSDAPSGGTDFFSQFSYIWHKRGNLTFRYRNRLRQENLLLDNNNEYFLAYIERHQSRIDFRYQWTNKWSTKSRAELVNYHKEFEESQWGLLIYQDLFFKPINRSWNGNIRVAYFDTESFDARIYAYESDVLYASSFPVYYQTGWRFYANVRWRLGKRLDLWSRYAITFYKDREEIGSGLDRIEGSKRSDVKIQLRYKL